MKLGNNIRETVTYEWVTAGYKWGHGYGKATTLETAMRKASAQSRKLERESGDGVKVPWRIYRRTVKVVYSECMEIALEGGAE